ncbi:hypothetical protein EDB19DRAFT_1730188 [Suillus lakei]|nr:hypothetical protein EDB19DRAFT_1730188 [Suillus lakei]
MNSDATEAALGLLSLSPLNNTIPQIRKPIPIPTPRPRPTTTPVQPAPSASPPLPDADAISCICGFLFDDGFSIACDVCSRWCHAACFDIVEGEVPEEWRCWDCDPRPVNRERAARLQKQRVTEMQAREREREKDRDKGRKRDRAGSPVQRRRASAAAIEGSGNAKKKRRASIISPSTPHPPPTPTQHGEDEPVDIDEPWSLSYVPITKDIVTTEAHARLRRQAQAWRGVTALSPPIHPNRTQIHPVPPTPSPSQLHTNPLVRPPTYSLHTTTPVPSSSYIAPFTCSITPSASYLADPLNAYAHLGMPKPFVHLMGPPLDVALDARVVGDEGRFARNGCRPNAVLRPLLCPKAKDESKTKDESEKEGTENGKKERRRKKNDKTDSDEETLTFGVFALRDLKANEEVVLGWEWDDGNAVHSLPALIESPHMFSSTFTTCACGARARDCVLNVMAQYVDGELDATSAVCGSGQPMNGTGAGLNDVGAGAMNSAGAGTTNGTSAGIMNGSGARQAGEADAGDGSSSDKENWGHEYRRTAVGLGIQMNANVAGTNWNGGTNINAHGVNTNANGFNGNTPSSSTFSRKIDLGPLIGAKRGFRTREKVPFGGGVGGVEMVPSGSGVNFGAGSTGGFGAELSGGFGAGSSGGLSSAGSDVWPSSFSTPAGPSNVGPNGGPSNWRPTISTSSAGPSRTSNSTRTRDRKGKGRAAEDIDVDADVDVEGDGPTPDSMDVDEEKIPPRMRKRWMHAVSVSDRDGRASSRNGRNIVSLNGQSLSSLHGQSLPVSSGHSPPATVSTTDWRSPASLSADSPAPMSGDSPSPPSPESTVDGMDVDVNDTSSDIRQMPPPPMPAALDPTTISSVAFASVSPSATFSKLSLLSPVLPDMRSGSPSLFGMPLTNSSRRPVPISSPPPYKSSNSKSPSDVSSAHVIVHPQSPSNPSTPSASSPYRVRFASPEVLRGQPSLKTTQHVPLKSGREPTPPIHPHTPPPMLEDDKATDSAIDIVPQSDRSPVHDGTSLEVKVVPPDEAPHAHTSTSSVMRDPTPPASSICESTPSLRDSDSPPPSCEPTLHIHEPTPAAHESTPPAYEHKPTPPPREQSPPPPPKVKMSLKDFALRKKKQREEMAKERERECESPGGLGMGLLEESGDEGMHVDEDGADERQGTDYEGTDQERDVEVTMTDVREAQDVVMDDDDDVRPAVDGVKDEPIASSAMQSIVDCVPEDPPAESQRRCESEPRGAAPSPPRSPVAFIRSVRSMDNAQPNGQPADSASLVAKIEIPETLIPNGLVGTYDRTSPSAPDPPPPPLHQQTKGAERQASPKTFTSPLPPSAPASYSLRPSHEDGEITSASPPKSSHFFPRSYTPPTQPRSFQTSHPSSPNFTHATSTSTPTTSSSASWRGPPPPIRPPVSNTPSSNGPSRPLPSGPRALRASSQSSHPPTYSSPSSRAYSSSQYIPRGPSADRDRHDRDRLDWERERGWASRSRGRTGSSGWGR